MYSCSLYFPRIHLYTQAPSVLLKCENIDEERLIAEAEATLEHTESLIKSDALDQLHTASGHRASLPGRSSADSQLFSNRNQAVQRGRTFYPLLHPSTIPSSVSSSSSSGLEPRHPVVVDAPVAGVSQGTLFPGEEEVGTEGDYTTSPNIPDDSFDESFWYQT
uniref:Retinol dehydrogenase 14 n=1 Tax=Mesocestoides corti TaxID=53468 RepID=A0A5K3FGU9_MESCO